MVYREWNRGKGGICIKNKVVVINADNMASAIENDINKELEDGWLIELFYEARGTNSNKIIVTLYKEESPVG